MKHNCGIIVKQSLIASIMAFIGSPSFKVFAEEAPKENEGAEKGGEEGGASSNKEPIINYEDLIAKARKEEKQKQYKEIEKLKNSIKEFTEKNNAQLLTIGQLTEELEKAKKALTTASKGDSEEVKTLKGEIEKLQKSNKDLEGKLKSYEEKPPVDENAIRAEIQKEMEAKYEVKTYKVEKLAEHRDDLLVPELVIGDTKEEIDASLKSALDRSNEIRKKLGISTKTKRTPKSVINPSINKVQDNEISLETLANMDVTSKEYRDLRKKLGLH